MEDTLCEVCESVDWQEAGLPRVLDPSQSGLFATSDLVRLPDGSIVSTSRNRLNDSSELLLRLGTVDNLQARASNCRFCELFLSLLHRHFSVDDINRADQDRAILNVFTCRHGTVLDQGPKQSQSFSVMCFELAFKHDFSCGGSARFALMQPDRETSIIQDCPTYLSRPIQPRINATQIREWREACERLHGASIASHPESGFLSKGPTSSDIRVVDVIERRITTIPIRDAQRHYASLSYVWGIKDQDVRLTTESITAFSKAGGVPTLSQTVEDALLVTKAIGLRYFWADVISILQDDEEDKEAYISDMDKIFTWSTVTIVAIAGGTCHEGLYGVSRDRIPLLHTTVNGVGLIEVQDQPRRPFRALGVTSGWPSRCWTLQEFIMSQNTILFCEQQVIWTCRGADWVEGLDVDGLRFRFKDYSGLNKPRLQSRVFADNEEQSVTSNESSATSELSDAATLIECYTSRKLTYDKDVKNAFEGLTWFMSSLSPDSLPGFLWGIPEAHFEGFLCWTMGPTAATPCRRRTTFPEAPSWSWMAWLGQIQFPYVVPKLHDADWKCFIKCYKYPTYLHRQGRDWIDINSGYEAEDTVLARPYDMFEGAHQLVAESTSLVFWAESTTVQLDLSSLNIHFHHGASSIRDQDGKRCPVQSLNVSESLVGDIQTEGVVVMTLIAVVAEGKPSDNGAIDSMKTETLPTDASLDPFALWERKLHCLLVSHSANDQVYREGLLTMRPADWQHMRKELKLFVLG